MKLFILGLLAVSSIALSACEADTHLRHDDQSRSSGEVGSTPY